MTRPVRRSIQAGQWYHHEDHPVHTLFRRGTANGTNEIYPMVGSADWKALFPPPFTFTNSTTVPSAWLKALNNAKAQNLIPDVPVPLSTADNPLYPNGTDPKGPEVCSATWFCRGPDDIWDAPDGYAGIAFDDGPLPNSSPKLYSFLKENNVTVRNHFEGGRCVMLGSEAEIRLVKATHFMIGSNILAYPSLFLEAYEQNDDIGCHTYNHPYMTTLTNEEVVLELGWQLELVRVSTNGRIPRVWRPPYGDVDNRVRAIATHVFGLQTVLWNHDSLDWELPQGPVTSAGLHQNYTLWYGGPKSPGLIILSHELTTQSVQGWIDAFPMIAQNNWITKSIPDLFEQPWYVNAQDDTAPVNQSMSVADFSTTSTSSTVTATSTGSFGKASSGAPSQVLLSAATCSISASLVLLGLCSL
ncbi:hypothetical protein FRB93_011595 [Tulasnella sp. JGI-2019a]|nr:hypothetical protein FRB93_011595 [Tulasnella sp. JGI-2019a]